MRTQKSTGREESEHMCKVWEKQKNLESPCGIMHDICLGPLVARLISNRLEVGRTFQI